MSGSIGALTPPTCRPRSSSPRLITAIQSARSPPTPTVAISTNGMIRYQSFRAFTKSPSSMQVCTNWLQSSGQKLAVPETQPVAPNANAPIALLSWP